MKVQRTSRAPADAGSVLLEATVGTGLLALVLASAAAVSLAASTSSSSAAERVAAVRDLADAYEVMAAGETPVPGGRVADVEVTRVRTPAGLDPCASAAAAGVTGTRVALPVRAGADHVALVGLVPVAEDAAGVLVRLAAAMHGGAAPLVRPAGATSPGAAVEHHDERCAASVLAAGRWELTLGAGAGLVDALHRPAADHPLALDVLEGTLERRWVLSEAAVLTVDLDARGARLPDEVPPGGIRWSVRGDDLRSASGSGGARMVHPGRVVVVASVCPDPEAQGSTVGLDLAPGSQERIALELGTVVVRGVGHAPDARLELVRASGCDGATPRIAWNGQLSDGMRIALPHGTWTAVLRMPQATLNRHAVVVTSEPDVEVVLA